jgi:DtxR family Mn-dependent transcriptional regulator
MKKRTPELEEYLETLVRYKEEKKEPKVKDLSKDLGVSAASVSEMLKKLSGKGLVKYERYGEIALTTKGEKLGRDVLRKHRLIEQFLILIGVKKDKIHDEACILEHALSDDVEKALRRALEDQPDVKHKDVKRLTDLKKGDKATIILIVCRRLTDMGLTPGTTISIGRASSRVGPVEVCIRDSCLAIGRGLAEKIFVKV